MPIQRGKGGCTVENVAGHLIHVGVACALQRDVVFALQRHCVLCVCCVLFVGGVLREWVSCHMYMAFDDGRRRRWWSDQRRGQARVGLEVGLGGGDGVGHGFWRRCRELRDHA